MIEYGYIENGFLKSRILEPYTVKEQKENGDIVNRTVSISEQIELLSPEYKPVDAVDEKLMNCDDDNYTIRLEPFDNGDRISFNYVKVVNNFKFRSQINALKDELAATDYQVIKCYEASLLGEPLPYDIKALHSSRNEIRTRINQYQDKFTMLKSNI